MRGSKGKIALGKYITSFSSGSHINKESKKVQEGYEIEYYKIKSFRLIPSYVHSDD
jgi:hypothetical protein